jgi:DNA-binding response OmpR family regulator
MGSRVLVIEDDPNIGELIQLYLAKQGYTVEVVPQGIMGLNRWRAEPPDLVILDLMLPDLNGWELCERIGIQDKTPIVVVTAQSGLNDKLRGFDLGIDDYLVKPFDPQELVARVKAVLRRNVRNDEATSEQMVSWPGLSINLETYIVLVNNTEVELTPREIQLLHFLASHPGRVFTREFLLQVLWGYDYPGGTRTVDVHINRLRDKVENSELPWHIRTVWGVGYKFEVK